jgi:alpha-amylase
VPTVYWKHYFDWGPDLRATIQSLINARKVAGVQAGSTVHTQYNAQEKRVYAALVVGRTGELYVRIGGSDMDWQPYYSNYHGYREYAHGAGWKVWVKLPGNPQVQQAPYKETLPIPEYRDPHSINVPDEWLN